jgi:hypothetical protein
MWKIGFNVPGAAPEQAPLRRRDFPAACKGLIDILEAAARRAERAGEETNAAELRLAQSRLKVWQLEGPHEVSLPIGKHWYWITHGAHGGRPD